MTPYSMVVRTNIANKKNVTPLCSGQKELKLENWFLSMLEKYTKLHGVTTHKIGIVTFTEVKKSKLCSYYLTLIHP